ncbi:MAG: DUF3658 domain-containing protein [Rhodoferax sp.]
MRTVSPPAEVHPVHLVMGESAAGCVRAACTSWAMPGTVLGFSGDLAQGPLDDEALLSQWRAIMAGPDLQQAEAVIVWRGDNVADAIFVAMACDQLAGRFELLLNVTVPGIDSRPFVAMHSPEQISQLYATRLPLSSADRQSLAQDFARIRDNCGPVRRLEQGRVVGVTIDYYDPLLLDACTADWHAAGRVVATAMAHCDGPNLIGDGFFSARLACLIEAGRLDARGPRTAPRDYQVRLARAPAGERLCSKFYRSQQT